MRYLDVASLYFAENSMKKCQFNEKSEHLCLFFGLNY